MSMYNLMHGVNKLSPIFLAILGIDQPNGEYESGRFRDIYLNKDGTKIILFTRNGGGNREQYQGVIDKLSTHPNYIKDYDDDYDCTYASIEFSTPEKFIAFTKALASGEEEKTLFEKSQNVIETMKSMTKDQLKKDKRFSPLVDILDQIVDSDNKKAVFPV